MGGLTSVQQQLIDSLPNQFPLSYPLDRFLWLESKPLDELVSQLVSEIVAARTGRKRKQDAEEKLWFFVKLLLLHLLMLHKFPRWTRLALPKGAGNYTVKGRYSQSILSYATMKEAYDRLKELGYIDVLNGHWNEDTKKGKVTRVDATPKLVTLLDAIFPEKLVIFTRHPNEETIIQKDEDKKRIEYRDTPYSNAARKNLQIINACLSCHWYDLELSNEQFNALAKAMAHKHERDKTKPQQLNLTARSLYRVFNDGHTWKQKDNFKRGGRYYGGWWESIPRDYRRFITIDHKHTVEVDYANLHPQMLYAEQGIKLQGDAYTIPGVRDRDMCKLAFQKLLNGGKDLKIPDDYDEAAIGMGWNSLLAALETKHAPIRRHFRTGYGSRLQCIDSEILEQVLLHFTKQDRPCLPIHDSVIIHYAMADELKAVMLAEYQKRFGHEINFKSDDNYQFFVEHYTGQGEETRTIETILADSEDSLYESRWDSWCSQKDKNNQ